MSDTDVHVRGGAERRLGAAPTGWGHPPIGPIVKLLLAYVIGVEVLLQGIFGRVHIPGIGEWGRYPLAIPHGEIVGGAVIGALYGLVAMGLILVYRANRIINFAQAQLGTVPAVLALLLIARHGWPYLLALVVMLVGAVILGATVEVT